MMAGYANRVGSFKPIERAFAVLSPRVRLARLLRLPTSAPRLGGTNTMGMCAFFTLFH